MPTADQLWGTFAVDDHLRERAFVAETVLFDHLVLPVPPADEEKQYDNWRDKGWQPDRAREMLKVLGDLAIPVAWGKKLRKQFRDFYAPDVDQDGAGGRAKIGQMAVEEYKNIKLASDDTLPKYVTRFVLADRMSDQADDAFYRRIKNIDIDPAANIELVVGYGSYGQFQTEVPLDIDCHPTVHTENATLLFGWEFLVPEDSADVSDTELLERAVKLAHKDEFIESRREFHEWRRKLIANRVDPEMARLEMVRCLEVYNDIIDKSRRRSRVLRALQVGATVAPLADFAVTGLGAGSAVVLGLGAFIFDGLVPNAKHAARERVAALIHDSREAFGRSNRGWHWGTPPN
jgi:hypothetical protein